MSDRIKITMLPAYVGDTIPDSADIPMSIAGVTYKVKPTQLPAATSGGTYVRLEEFKVTDSSVMVPGDEVYTNDDLVGANGVQVFIGGTLVPNLEIVDDTRWINFDNENNYLTVVGGVNDGEHVSIAKF